MHKLFTITADSIRMLPGRRTLGAALFIMFVSSISMVRSTAAQSIQQFVGNVADPSHAVIVGATVTIHNEGTGEDVVVKTTRAGDYTAPYLKQGVYTVTADKAGFKSLSYTHIELSIDKTAKIDFILPVGSANETVTVSSAGVQIELAKADRGEVIDAERVQELPTDGRNVLELFELSAGSINTHNPQFTRPQDNVAGDLHVNGIGSAPVQENIDGATNDNASGYLGYPPPPDSVAEFKVVINPYDASYGRAGGGAIDISLKSGTNKYHGDMYDYIRRPFLDAQSYQYDYNLATLLPGAVPPIPARHKRDQFGLELDGPVIIPHLYNGKDNTFFTIQWEQAYESLPSTSANISSIPDLRWLTGDFSTAQYFNSATQSLMPLIIYDPNSPVTTVKDPIDGKTKRAHSPFPGNIIPMNRLDPVGLAIAQYYKSITPNYNPGPGYAPFQNNYFNLQLETDVSRNGLVKIDHNFGPNDRGTVRWEGFERYDSYNSNGIPASNPANNIAHQLQPKDNNFAIDEIHTFSSDFILDNKVTLLNEKQGFNNGGNLEPGVLPTLGFSPHYVNNAFFTNLFPSVSVNNNPGTIGLGGSPLGFTIVHNLAYQPSVTVVRGRHTVRAGFDMRLLQLAQPGSGAANNSFTFTNKFTQQFTPASTEAPGYTSGSGVAALLLGDPSSTGPNNTATSIKYSISPFYSQHYYAFWAQDDWKVTPKLTLNFGVRYDLLGARTERFNKLNYAFDTTTLSPVDAQVTNRAGLSGPIRGGIQFAGANGAPRGAYATNLLNIQPRFGAAYAFSSRTSLRAGFGEMFVNDEGNDSSNGFSSSATSFADTTGVDPLTDNTTPYGHLSDPFPGYVTPTGSSLGLATTLGSTVNFKNPNYKIPSLWEYSVSLQQLLSNRDFLDISYSGTRAYNLAGSIDINHVSSAFYAQCNVENGGNRQLCDGSGAPAQVANPFKGVPAFAGTGNYYTNSLISAGALTRPFPQFTAVSQDSSNLIHSWYNSLQVSASHIVSKSLTVHATYTWSKNMSAGNIIDQVYGVRSRILTANDVPNVITFSSVFYLPVGRGKALLGTTNRLVDAVVGGWEISPLYVYTEGVPWNNNGAPGPGYNWEATSTYIGIKAHDLRVDGTHNYKRLQGVTPCVAYKDTDSGAIKFGPAYIAAGCTSPALIRTPNQYTPNVNTVGWHVRVGAVHEFDASLSKRFTWNDKLTLQTRLDAFNVLNHPNWNNSFNNDPTSINWGTVSKGPSGPGTPVRDLQISGKLIW